MNQLILGDNLEIMRKMDAESIDLIYLDPPFFSNRNYEVIWGDKGEVRSFEDRWSGGVDHYIAWLKERVAEMHRLLKPSGSIYLHCDWHADAYIRIFILDKIFGENNFINNIIWSYKRYTAQSKKFQNLHDSIFWYSKDSKQYTFNEQREDYGENSGKMDSHYKQDDDGRWYRNQKRKDKEPYKVYLSEGKRTGDVWEIPIINASAKERIGYPTQKPEKLLERIILASSNEGDIVMDPFVGGGTTIAVADRLNRSWLGIDQSVQAIKLTELRINKLQRKLTGHIEDIFSHDFIVQLHKYDYDTLRYKDAFEFESWIITQFGNKFGFGAIPQNKKGGDKGFDGKTRNGTPIQVKRSDNISVNVVKNFYSSCLINERQDTDRRIQNSEPIGYIIAFSFGSGAIQEVAKLKNSENIIIKLVRVDEIVEIAHKPKLSIQFNDLGIDEKELRIIEFIATGISDVGIEFYSWDFEYNSEEKIFNPDIMLDKEGKQTHKFKAGTHNIAVKVVDNEGLEALEVVKVKVNGVVEIK